MQPLSFIESKPQGTIKRLVIFLHGLGSNNQEVAGISALLGLENTAYIFPQAEHIPVSIYRHTMPAWYDVQAITPDIQEDSEGIVSCAHRLHAIMDYANTLVPSKQIYLMGFSQGGAMALYAGLTYSNSIAGIVNISGYLPLRHKLAKHRHVNNQHTPLHFIHSNHDLVVPFELAKMSASFLRDLGYKINWQEHTMGHTIDPSVLLKLGTWVTTITP